VIFFIELCWRNEASEISTCLVRLILAVVVAGFQSGRNSTTLGDW